MFNPNRNFHIRQFLNVGQFSNNFVLRDYPHGLQANSVILIFEYFRPSDYLYFIRKYIIGKFNPEKFIICTSSERFFFRKCHDYFGLITKNYDYVLNNTSIVSKKIWTFAILFFRERLNISNVENHTYYYEERLPNNDIRRALPLFYSSDHYIDFLYHAYENGLFSLTFNFDLVENMKRRIGRTRIVEIDFNLINYIILCRKKRNKILKKLSLYYPNETISFEELKGNAS